MKIVTVVNKRVSRKLPVLACVLSFLLLIGAVAAYDFAALKPQGYVSDFAAVLTPPEKAILTRYCAAMEKQLGVQVAVVTLQTLYGEPIEDVANELYRSWGIGRKETDEGLLILLVLEDRRSRIEVGYGLEPIITDGFAGSVLRSMRPALREGSYGAALMMGLQTLAERIARAKGVRFTLQSAPVDRRAARRQPPVANLLPLLLFGLGFVGWLFGVGTLAHRRRRYGGYVRSDPVTGWLFPMLMIGSMMRGGGGMVRYGGGGFGGYDSWDGFGGFGGGDAGGGGASSSW